MKSNTMTNETDDNVTRDDLLHGELKLWQHRHGYRYSVDALLLADFAMELARGARVLDLGTGAGTVALILAARGKVERMVGVEVQEGLARRAEQNAENNKTNPPVEIVRGDALEMASRFGPSSFDLVVTNPPYRELGAGKPSPHPERAIARSEVKMSLGPWLAAAMELVGRSGGVCLVYPVDREARLMRVVEELGLFIARRSYAIDRPGGARKLVLLDLRARACPTSDLAEVPIETDDGKFSLDGYR